MKTLELENSGIRELSFDEKSRTVGGITPWVAFYVGVGIGVASIAVYDFINGVYSGIKQELATPKYQ